MDQFVTPGPITSGLLDRIEQELLSVYDGTDLPQPPTTEPVILVLQQTMIDLHDRARDLAGCNKVDTCTAEAIVCRALADRLAELAAEVGRRGVAVTTSVDDRASPAGS